MQALTLEEVAEYIGARWEGQTVQVTGVCTDTRSLQPGDLFFALKGESSDGHCYVANALAKGAVAAVVSELVPATDGIQLTVTDTLAALGNLANGYRRRFSIPIIGITGSVGKTSTKEMLAKALSAVCPTLANEKNFNNEIGVPHTLFRLESEHRVGVIEMGMRGTGEIARLAAIAEPTIAVITNIGFTHIERLGSREAIADAKAELLTHLPDGGIAILPVEDAYFAHLQRYVPQGCRVLTYAETPKDNADVAVIPLGEGRFEVVTPKGSYTGRLKVRGSHHFHNAAAVCAVGVALDFSLPTILEAMESWEGAEGRMREVQTPSGIHVLDDCYNASAESMRAGLRLLAETSPSDSRKRVAVLGDMKELGDYAPQIHRYVGQQVAENQVDRLLTVGELAKTIGEEATSQTLGGILEWHHFSETSECAADILRWVGSGDVVLIKGSRAMEMEAIVSVLTGEAKAVSHG